MECYTRMHDPWNLKGIKLGRQFCANHLLLVTYKIYKLFKVLVLTIDAQWEGMGDVRSARYELALRPPCPTIRGFKLQ